MPPAATASRRSAATRPSARSRVRRRRRRRRRRRVSACRRRGERTTVSWSSQQVRQRLVRARARVQRRRAQVQRAKRRRRHRWRGERGRAQRSAAGLARLAAWPPQSRAGASGQARAARIEQSIQGAVSVSQGGRIFELRFHAFCKSLVDQLECPGNTSASRPTSSSARAQRQPASSLRSERLRVAGSGPTSGAGVAAGRPQSALRRRKAIATRHGSAAPPS